jgi:hypothetical protein
LRTYWIWNRYRRCWHSGKYTITDSVIRENFEAVSKLYYRDTGIRIIPDQFVIHQFPPVKQAKWVPKTPEEIAKILW